MIEKINNKFTVYDSEELTVLELIEELGNLTNDNIEGLKGKTDLYGDHKGSWQGINRPTMSEEGLRGTVEKIIDEDLPRINEQLETIITKNTEINVLDYGLKGNGEVEDLTILKEILSNKLTNVTLYFPSNKTYKINEPITIKGDNCIIKLDGEIVAQNDGIIFDDVNDSIISINIVRKEEKYNLWHDWNNGKYIDYSTFNNNGVIFNNFRNNKININRVESFKNGLYFNPSTFTLTEGNVTYSGIQYNTFDLGSVYACANCIIFECGGNNTWVNSNIINGGMLSGGLGLYFKNTAFSNTDDFNQNSFNNNGFEYCRNGGILIEKGKDNTFLNFRFDKVDNYYIKSSEQTKRISFDTNYQVFYEGCELKGEGHTLKASIYKYGDLTNPLANKSIYLTPFTKLNETTILRDDAMNSTEGVVLSGVDKPLSSVYRYIKDAYGNVRPVYHFPKFTKTANSTLVITLENMGNIFYPDTRKGNVIYQFSKEVESIYIGFPIKIFTTGNSEPNRIAFKNSDGTDITLPSLAYSKFYYLLNIGGEFKLIELGNILN